MSTFSEKNDFALVPKTPAALEKVEPGAKRLLSGMVADTLALARVEDAETIFNRGGDYYSGNGVPIDYTMAAKCFREAAEKGHAAAQCRLGFCYEFGKGVTADDGEAVRWYRMGAEQGYAQAQFYFGFCYTSGHGVAQDDIESAKWIRMAAEQGLAEAQQWLGICHNNGTCGFPQDQIESVKWFRKAAEQGDAHSQFCLGRYYLSGMGVVMDRVEALKWFRLADAYEEVASTETLLSPEELQEAERRIRDFKAVHLVKRERRSKPRIVLVNDHSDTLQLMKSLICDCSKEATVLTFQSGGEAWQELRREDPDLLITDMQRPNDPVDGWAMIPLLANKKVKYPVVVVSALAEFSAENANKTTKAASAAFHNLLEHARQTLNITALAIPFENEEFWKMLEANLKISRNE